MQIIFYPQFLRIIVWIIWSPKNQIILVEPLSGKDNNRAELIKMIDSLMV